MALSGLALFDRRCRLTIANPVDEENNFSKTQVQVIEIDGGTTDNRAVSGMRVAFKITKTLKKEPNTSEIVVTNLSPKRRSSLQHKGVKVMLEAGYKATGVKKYFSGDVRTIDHVRNNADWDTTMKLGDGERAWGFARISESFAPGTPKANVVRTIAKSMGLELGNLDEQLASLTGTIDQGFAAAGPSSHAMNQIITSLGKEWSVQDGQLQILDPYQVLNLPVPEISVSSGLLDSPEMGTPPKKGKPALVKFKSLLIPVKPGGKVKLVSERYNGYVRVVAVTFTGDTHGGSWETEISGQILQ